MKTKTYFSFFLFSLIIVSSCRRDRDVDTDTSGARDNALAESSFNEIQTIADQAQAGDLGNYRDMNDTIYLGCATIIRDTLSTPRSITVDFGTVNCECADGKERRGKIVTSYTGSYRDSGTVITHIPVDYFINDNQITGTKTVTNMGKNSDNHTWFDISVSGTIIKANGGGTITWISDREREWIEGESTGAGYWQDDVYLITGSASGTGANGNSFTSVITEALRIELDCEHITGGEFEFTPSNKPVRTVNFGSGACDNEITVTINGNTYTITLQ